MHITTALVVAAFAAAAHAHSTMFSVWVNDVDQGDGRHVYIRSPPNNNPIKDLASPDLVCNVNGAKAVDKFVPVTAGDKLTFEWYHDNRNDDIIAESHRGPIITYIAPYTEGNGASAVWTKIAEEGFDGSLWAVDKLIANKGKKDFILPASLAAGKYLVRQEIIALHEADTTFNINSARGAQFYPSCVQVEVSGSGTAVPDQNFNFNTGYTYADPGIKYNVYDPSKPRYVIPGPKVWLASSSQPTVPSSTSSSSSEEGTPATPTSEPAISQTIPTVVSTAVALPSSAASAPATIPLPTPAISATITAPTTLATVRRPTKSSIQSILSTATKSTITSAPAAVVDCTPVTRTVTVHGRPLQF